MYKCYWSERVLTPYMPPSAWCLYIFVSVTPLPSSHHITQQQQNHHHHHHACCCEGRCHLVDKAGNTGPQALTVSNRQCQFTEARCIEWLQTTWPEHTCCAAQSLTRFGFGDNSRENGSSIGALFEIFVEKVLWPRSRTVQGNSRSKVMLPIDSPWVVASLKLNGCFLSDFHCV